MTAVTTVTMDRHHRRHRDQVTMDRDHRDHRDQVTMDRDRLPPSTAVPGVTSRPRQQERTACRAVASDAKECSRALTSSRLVAVCAGCGCAG